MTTVADVVNKAYTKVNGEFEIVTETSDDFKTYLNVLNQVMELWAHTAYIKWQSLFNADYLLPDKVAVDRFVYPVSESSDIIIANSPFDSVFFVDDADVLIAKYKMTDQALFQSSTVSGICALFAGQLHIQGISDEIVGTNIKLPAYVLPPVYTTGSQVIAVDSVPWLVTSMAAFICDASPVPFIARNADKFYKEAAIYMKEMRENNRHRQHIIIKSVTGVRGGQPTNAGDMVGLLGAQGVLGGGTGGLSVLDGGSA